MGTAKPMPTKSVWSLGLARPVTMPTTWPALLSSGPPELPGLTAASNWMRCSSLRVALDGDRAVEGRHDAGGERVGEAERVAHGEDGRPDLHAAAEHGGHDGVGQPLRAQGRDVALGGAARRWWRRHWCRR